MRHIYIRTNVFKPYATVLFNSKEMNKYQSPLHGSTPWRICYCYALVWRTLRMPTVEVILPRSNLAIPHRNARVSWECLWRLQRRPHHWSAVLLSPLAWPWPEEQTHHTHTHTRRKSLTLTPLHHLCSGMSFSLTSLSLTDTSFASRGILGTWIPLFHGNQFSSSSVLVLV